MGEEFGIKRRINFLAQEPGEAIDERVLTLKNKNFEQLYSQFDKKFSSKLSKLPSDISCHTDLFERSYYHKKYKVKVDNDLSESYQIALQNIWKNKTDKALKYFKLALKHEEIKQSTGENAICQLFELKIVLGIEPNEKDLLELKRAIGVNDKRAKWLLDAIGLQQHGETYKFTKLDETQNILFGGIRENAKKFSNKSDAGLMEIVGGEQAMEMAKLYSKEGQKRKAYYLIKYAAVCCYNLNALMVLVESKPEKDEYYKKLYEEAKNIFSSGRLSANPGILQETSEELPIEFSKISED